MKQKELRGLLKKDVLNFQHFPPDRKIRYENNLKCPLHASIFIGQLLSGICVGFVPKD
jgi:hypothetical protein